MADFCKQCSEIMFGPEITNDFVGLTSDAAWSEGVAVAVLCEGCGPIQVDPTGECVSVDCLERHGKKVL